MSTDKIVIHVSDEEKQRRLVVCSKCENSHDNVICGICGCAIAQITQYNFKSCPQSKW